MMMELYASPMACSLASHITALEADLPVSIRYVDTKAKKTDDGEDYLSIAPGGYVPALRLAGGQLLNEGPSVLQYLADQKPEKKLAPPWGTIERYQLIDTLNYLSTEVHKHIFHPLFASGTTDAAKQAHMAELAAALDSIARRLGDREHLVGAHFTVADAYLYVMLTWALYLGADLKRWPILAAHHQRVMARPTVAKAFAEEMEERRRRAA
jgi:glutathione S-transferase